MDIGDEIFIFKDYETETDVLAKVKLLSLKREGLPFILEDMKKEEQIVYKAQYWECEIINSNYYNKGYIKTFPIRCLLSVGSIPSTNVDDIQEENYTIIDKFLEIDGEEIF